MNFARLFSLNIFSIIYLLIVIFSLVLRKQQYAVPNRLFIAFAASTAFVLLFEIFSWYFEGKPGRTAERSNYMFNFIFLCLNPLPAVAWLCYIDYKIHASTKRLRKRLYYLPILLATTALLIITARTGWVFRIGGGNVYTRGPGNIYFTILIFLIIYLSVPMVVKNRKHIDRNIFFAFYAFSFFPLAGAVLQLVFPGTLLVWNAVALAVLTTFIFLEIQYLSKDFLTGLYNRRQIDEWIGHRVRLTRRGKPSFALILIDLDNFKDINDSFGHAEGDQALTIFSNILTHSVKSNDMAGRYAGDEFIITLETTEPDAAESVIRRVRQKTENFNAKEIKPYHISFSAGSAVFDPEKHEDSTGLFKEVDAAMYRNKERNRK